MAREDLVTVELENGEQVEMGAAEVEQYLADHPGAHVVEEAEPEGKRPKAEGQS